MSTITTERDGRVLTATIADPPMNFMTAAMVDDLDALVADVERDGRVRAVVLTGGVEGSFVTHYDVAEILAGAEPLAGGPALGRGTARGVIAGVGTASRLPGAGGALGRSPAAGVLALRRIHDLFLRMNRLDAVVIAAINGSATGGGCELALACDLRYMADDPSLRIGLPELTLGIIPGAGGTQRMARALGPARALELILEGRPLAPREALEAGLVHRLVSPGELPDRARETAERMARRARGTVGAAKRAVYEGASRPLPAGLRTEAAEFLAVGATPAAVRGMQAYVEAAGAAAAPGEVPFVSDEAGAPWREGTAVDLSE